MNPIQKPFQLKPRFPAILLFLLAIFLFAAVREQLDVSSECPKAFEGFPIALVTAGLMALAFMGFSGLQVW